MKLIRKDSPTTGKTTLVLEMEEGEIIKSIPTKMELEMLKIAKATDKISDYLMYFSEVAKNIEDNKKGSHKIPFATLEREI